MSMKEIWLKSPAWLKALLLGIVLFFPVIITNQLLLFQNLAKHNSIPWSLPIILVILWLYWKFTSGIGQPFRSSVRRTHLSKSSIHLKGNILWIAMAIMGLMLFTYSIVAIGYSFVDAPTAQLEMIKLFTVPKAQTAIPLILGLSLTAGIVEEVVFRGYMQTMLEDSYGVKVSFVLTAIVFVLLHFLPTVLLVPYMLVSLAFSYVRYKSDSIIPGVIAHAGFDFLAISLIYFYPSMTAQSYFEDTILISLSMGILSAFLIWYSQKRFSTDKTGMVNQA